MTRISRVLREPHRVMRGYQTGRRTSDAASGVVVPLWEVISVMRGACPRVPRERCRTMVAGGSIHPAVDPAAFAREAPTRAGMPDGRWVLLSPQEVGQYDGAAITPAEHSACLGRVWRLPVGGYGNGWKTPRGHRSSRSASRSSGYRLRDRSRRPETYRLWVGASAHGRAEQVLVAVMPGLAQVAARCADSAWR